MIVVDAGNLLFKKPLSGPEGIDNTAALVTAYGLVRAYNQMSYDAIAVSSNDLSAGTEFFQRTRDNSFPWVAANIYDNNAQLLFSPHIIKKSASLTIGIIGLTGTTGSNTENFVIGDWRKALRKEITLLENNCDILVVLSNLNMSENKEIQRDFNQIDIIVTADQRGRNIQPQVSLNSLLTQSGGRGKYIGRLDITLHGQGNWLAASSQSLAQPGKSYKSSFLPVKPKPARGKIGAIVQDIKKSINAFNSYLHAGLQPGDPAIRLALQSDEITGITKCFQCHEKQTEFWKKTRHAIAYTTLSQHGQSFNLQCLPCHVTAGKVGPSSVDFELLYLLTLSSDRQTIGCEVCHGPGNHHLLSPNEITPVRLPAEKICLQCHTPDRDNNFDYQRKLATIACPAD